MYCPFDSLAAFELKFNCKIVSANPTLAHISSINNALVVYVDKVYDFFVLNMSLTFGLDVAFELYGELFIDTHFSIPT